jgi:outer membrane lipoprotein-sorting protein
MEGAMMRRLTLYCCCTAIALVGCAKSDDTTTDTAAGTASATAAPTPAMLNLADVAGKWNVRAVPESGTDTAATTYVLTANPDTTGWTIAFTGKPQPVKIHVMAAGDSITYKSDQYASVRRKGMQVWTEGVSRMQDGKLVGTAIAHYKTTGPDSVLRLRTEGTKAQ